MNRTAILGGAFDPPTLNHMLGAAEVVNSGQVDEVWLVPCGRRPDKPKVSAVLDRYIMTQISASTCFSADFPVHVSDVELHAPEMIPTYDLLRALRRKHPDREFFLVIGTDWLQPGTDIRQWTSKDENGHDIVTGHLLLAEFDFLVLRRPGYDVPNDDLKAFGPRLRWLTMPDGATLMEGNISSTEIRKRMDISTQLLDGPELIEGLATPAVIAYICHRGLYRQHPGRRRSVSSDITSGRLSQPSDNGQRRPSSASANCCFSWVCRPLRQPKLRRNIAVFGGAFDPPTHSHMLGLAEIIRGGMADEVLMVPCGPRPDKPHLRPALMRYIMCELAVSTSFSHRMPISVSNLEVFEEEALATYDSLRALRENDPSANLMFVIGSDWLQGGSDLRQWTSKCPDTGKQIVTGDKLLNEFDFLVIKRPGFEVQDLASFGPRMMWLNLPHGMKPVQANMSSTEVRKRAKMCYNGSLGEEQSALKLIDGIVPTSVFNFIKRHDVYKQ